MNFLGDLLPKLNLPNPEIWWLLFIIVLCCIVLCSLLPTYPLGLQLDTLMTRPTHVDFSQVCAFWVSLFSQPSLAPLQLYSDGQENMT